MKFFLKDSLNPGKIFFYTGLFLLPSAFSIGSICLIISLIFSFKSGGNNFFNDKLNLIFIISCLTLLISSAINFIDKNSIHHISSSSFLIFLGLSNWIPQIFVFIGFQKYLVSSNERKICATALITGSIPIIFSCFSQSLLNWHGPMRTLFGLIVWYQRPIDGFTDITGLFSNPNYLGAWLNIIWPFLLALIFFDNRNKFKFFFKLILTVSTTALIILTASRSAWICLLIPIPLIYPSPYKKYFFYSISLISFLLINLVFPILGKDFQLILRQIIPEGLWINFVESGFETLDISRIEIWQYASSFIANQPIFGYGSRSFTPLFLNQTSIWKGHSHNLPLELMVSYGIPSALLILVPISYLIYKSYAQLLSRNARLTKQSIIDKAWIVSLSSLILMHLVDIQYFDGRISITSWILLAGARNIILQDKVNDS